MRAASSLVAAIVFAAASAASAATVTLFHETFDGNNQNWSYTSTAARSYDKTWTETNTVKPGFKGIKLGSTQATGAITSEAFAISNTAADVSIVIVAAAYQNTGGGQEGIAVTVYDASDSLIFSDGVSALTQHSSTAMDEIPTTSAFTHTFTVPAASLPSSGGISMKIESTYTKSGQRRALLGDVLVTQTYSSGGGNTAPVATQPSVDVAATVGTEATVDLANYFYDTDGDQLTFALDSGVGAVNGSIWSFTPTAAGSFSADVTATDPSGDSAVTTISVTAVLPPLSAPLFEPTYPEDAMADGFVVRWMAVENAVGYDLVVTNVADRTEAGCQVSYSGPFPPDNLLVTATVTDLDADTLYAVAVRALATTDPAFPSADYSDSDWSAPVEIATTLQDGLRRATLLDEGFSGANNAWGNTSAKPGDEETDCDSWSFSANTANGRSAVKVGGASAVGWALSPEITLTNEVAWADVALSFSAAAYPAKSTAFSVSFVDSATGETNAISSLTALDPAALASTSEQDLSNATVYSEGIVAPTRFRILFETLSDASDKRLLLDSIKVTQVYDPNYAVLPAPTGVAGSDIGKYGFTVSWNAVANATAYEVWLNGELAAFFEATSTSMELTGLSDGTEYSVQVRATGDKLHYGDSPLSAAISVTTLADAQKIDFTVTGAPAGDVFAGDAVSFTVAATNEATHAAEPVSFAGGLAGATFNAGTPVTTTNTYTLKASVNGRDGNADGFGGWQDDSNGNAGYFAGTEASGCGITGFAGNQSFGLYANNDDSANAVIVRPFSHGADLTAASVDVGMLWDSGNADKVKGIEFLDASGNPVFGVRMGGSADITYYGAGNLSGTWSTAYGTAVFNVALVRTASGYTVGGTTRDGGAFAGATVTTAAAIASFKAYMNPTDDNANRQLYFDNLSYTTVVTEMPPGSGAFSWTPTEADVGDNVATFTSGAYSTNVAIKVVSAFETETLETENFSKISSSSWTSTTGYATEMAGDIGTWTGVDIVKTKSAVIIGRRTSAGTIVSPAVELKARTPGSFSVSFDTGSVPGAKASVRAQILDAADGTVLYTTNFATVAALPADATAVSDAGARFTVAPDASVALPAAVKIAFTTYTSAGDDSQRAYVDTVVFQQTVSARIQDLPAPTGLAVVGEPGESGFTFGWTAVDGATNYAVRVKDAGGAVVFSAPFCAATQAAVSGLADDEDFAVQVRATGDETVWYASPWSEALAVRTARSAEHPTLSFGAWQNAVGDGKVYGGLLNTAAVSAVRDNGSNAVVALTTVLPAPSAGPTLEGGVLSWIPADADTNKTFTISFLMDGNYATNLSFKVFSAAQLEPPTVTAGPVAWDSFGLSWNTQYRAAGYAVRVWTDCPNPGATATRVEESFANWPKAKPVGWSYHNMSSGYKDAAAPVSFDATGDAMTTYDLGGPISSVSFHAAGHSIAGSTSALTVVGIGADDAETVLATLTASDIGQTDAGIDRTLAIAEGTVVRKIAWRYTKDKGGVGVGSVVIEGAGFSTPKFLPGWGPVAKDVGLVQACTVAKPRPGKALGVDPSDKSKDLEEPRVNYAEVTVRDAAGAALSATVEVDVPAPPRSARASMMILR